MAVVVVAGPEGQCPMKAAGTHARRSELLSVMSVCPFLVVTGDLRGRPAKPHFKDENMGVQRRLCLDWGLCSLWTEGLKAARLTWGFGRGCAGVGNGVGVEVGVRVGLGLRSWPDHLSSQHQPLESLPPPQAAGTTMTPSSQH